MKVKKLICMILAIVCIVSVAACGQEQPTQNNVNTAEFPPEPDPDETGAPATSSTEKEPEKVPETPQEAFPVEEDAKVELSGVWEGHKELNFAEFFKQGVKKLFENSEGGVLENCEISIVEGWNCEGFLDESIVAEGNAPISYIAYLTLKSGETATKIGYKFYMERNADGILIAKGAESFVSGAEYGEVFSEEETKELLDELKTAIN